MNIFQILQVLLPIILISALGYIYARFRKAEPQVVSDIIIYLSIPALFFNSFYSHDLILKELPGTFLTITMVMGATALLIYLLKQVWPLPRMLYATSLFMNSSFVGFPVMLLAYGQEGLNRAIIYDFFNGILIFTLGIYIASGRKDRFELFKVPFFYASILGLGLNLMNVELPAILLTSIQMLGSITIPLALLMLGFRLGMTRIRSLALPALSTVLRMVLGAVLAFGLVRFFKIGPEFGKALIVMSALPSAFMGLVLAEKYKTEEDFTASAIALSTLFAVIFIPILLWILK